MTAPVDAFRYDLPDDAIAQVPIEPRDAARLLDTRSMSDRQVSDLPELLEPGDVLVVNATRVRAARLQAHKETGGQVELLLLAPIGAAWECLVRPARRIRPGTTLTIGPTHAVVTSEPDAGRVMIEFPDDLDVEQLADRVGTVPLPPYIRTQIEADRYQTVYAGRVGSAAAPTAGLHLTESILNRLRAKDIDVAEVDLEVGLGTFRPITTARVEDHRMHQERFTVPAETADLVSSGRRVVAVGTTVVRALESAALDGFSGHPSTTELFIRPGFTFRVVDLLMTNFHVPGSSLVVMVAAFMGEEWRSAYEIALARGYRFLSFGDAMLCGRQ